MGQKQKIMVTGILLLIASWILVGCAGLEVAMENRNVQVISNLDNVPFFETHPGQKVYISIRNFSEYKDLDQLNQLVAQKYQQRGFVVVNSPQQADWTLEAKIVNVKKEDFSAREVKGGSSQQDTVSGAIMGGMAAGFHSGNVRDAVAGAIIGGVLSGAASLTVDSWVKLGYITIITDIQVKERKNVFVERTGTQQIGNIKEKVVQKEQENWLKYRFQALTRAKKANLKWEDCKDAMVKEISRILASLL